MNNGQQGGKETKAPSLEQIEFLRLRQKMHKELPQSIKEKANRLREMLKPYNPLDVIANSAFTNVFFNPETYKEPRHQGMQAHVEYIALMCLKDAYREGDTRLIDGPTLEKMDTTVREIFRETLWYYMTETADPEDPSPRSALERLRQETIIEELIVRNPAYFHHLEEMLRELFSLPAMHDAVRNRLGFDFPTALQCVRAIGELAEDKLNERRNHARARAKRLRTAVRQYRRTKTSVGEFEEPLLQYLARENAKKARRLVKNCATAWAFTAFGDLLSFTAAELAARTGCAEDDVRAFLRMFSVDFGAVPSDFVMPSPTHHLQATPIIRHPGGYFCAIPNLLLWAIRPGIEGALKGDAKLWEKYQKARAGFLIDESLRWLKKALPAAETHKNLKYRRTEGGNVVECEIDGLVLFDTVAFLLEGKAGGLTPPARRGAPLRLKKEIEKLIAEPHRQALRARSFIAETPEPVFTLPDGRELPFEKERVKTFVLVTVTLDPLDTFTTALHKTKELGMFANGDSPWAVYVLNLRVISEMLEFPSQLVHYLGRRLPLNDLAKFHAHDELDWFGNYISEGLFLERRPELKDADNVSLASYTTDFDDYYRYETGHRTTPAKKPRQPMPDLVRQVMRELEANDGRGYLAVTMAILDMSGKSWKDFAKFIERQRRAAKKDGRTHDFTLTFEEGRFGITFMCARDLLPEAFGERLTGFCVLRKYRAKADRWVGIGSLVGGPGIVHMWVANDAAWEFDEQLEELDRRVLSTTRSSKAREER